MEQDSYALRFLRDFQNFNSNRIFVVKTNFTWIYQNCKISKQTIIPFIFSNCLLIDGQLQAALAIARTDSSLIYETDPTYASQTVGMSSSHLTTNRITLITIEGATRITSQVHLYPFFELCMQFWKATCSSSNQRKQIRIF